MHRIWTRTVWAAVPGTFSPISHCAASSCTLIALFLSGTYSVSNIFCVSAQADIASDCRSAAGRECAVIACKHADAVSRSATSAPCATCAPVCSRSSLGAPWLVGTGSVMIALFVAFGAQGRPCHVLVSHLSHLLSLLCLILSSCIVCSRVQTSRSGASLLQTVSRRAHSEHAICSTTKRGVCKCMHACTLSHADSEHRQYA